MRLNTPRAMAAFRLARLSDLLIVEKYVRMKFASFNFILILFKNMHICKHLHVSKHNGKAMSNFFFDFDDLPSQLSR